jgi:hypothetical protein
MEVKKDHFYLNWYGDVIRILCVDRPKHEKPVLGLCHTTGYTCDYYLDGKHARPSRYSIDLVWECDEYGKPIAPDPAPGQVWKNKYGDYLLNEVHAPQGRVFYVAVNEEGYQCRGAARTPEDAVRGMTFVRESQ